jgi:hypothetical protein
MGLSWVAPCDSDNGSETTIGSTIAGRHHNPPNSENEKGRIEQKLRRHNNSSGDFLASMERARDDKKPMNLRRLDP